ncbi:MAG: hypothetical protein ABIJ46_02500 [bacterium]
MDLIERNFRRLTQSSRRSALVVFVLAAAAYAVLEATASFRDPDSFYHAEMARVTWASGPVREFPWLPFTTLADAFADHHFLYHLLLGPFVSLLGPFYGLATATVLFGAAAVAAFYLVTRAFGLRFGWAFTLLAATSVDLMFRLNLAKASSLAVILLLVGFVAAVRGRRWSVLGVAWLYVWAHGSWPLLPFVVLAVAVSASLVSAFRADGRVRLVRRILSALVSAESTGRVWSTFALCCLGSAAGLVANPFFPANLEFYWRQTVQVALVGLPAAVEFGVEWLPYSPLELLSQNGAMFVAVLLVAGGWVAALLAGSRASRGRAEAAGAARNAVSLLSAAVVSAALLALTLHSRRHVEFLTPFMLLDAAIAFDWLLRRTDPRRLADFVFSRHPRLRTFAACYAVAALCLLPVRGYVLVHRSMREGARDWSSFVAVGEWMRLHVPSGSVVFTGDWSDFPAIFLNFPAGRYVIGLDAGFLYLRDRTLYDEWRRLSSGEAGDRTAERVAAAFDASYVLVRRDQVNLRNAVQSDPDLVPVYGDGQVELFMRLRPADRTAAGTNDLLRNPSP